MSFNLDQRITGLEQRMETIQKHAVNIRRDLEHLEKRVRHLEEDEVEDKAAQSVLDRLVALEEKTRLIEEVESKLVPIPLQAQYSDRLQKLEDWTGISSQKKMKEENGNGSGPWFIMFPSREVDNAQLFWSGSKALLQAKAGTASREWTPHPSQATPIGSKEEARRLMDRILIPDSHSAGVIVNAEYLATG